MIDISKALSDPSSVFRFPKEVLDNTDLDNATKLQILNQWELDARELAVAEEENMVGDGPSMLSRVLRAKAVIVDNLD